MAITAGMVKELRETTGAGMMDCKKALTETNGDMEAAVELLKKSGAAKMAKKAARIAAEGICRVAVDGNKAVVVEVNSETDFVAKNEVFQAFVQDVADKALASGACGGVNGEDVQTLLDGGLTEEFADKTLKIGEKLSFRRFETVEGDCVASYIHGGGRIGVLVAASGASDAAAKEALTNVATAIMISESTAFVHFANSLTPISFVSRLRHASSRRLGRWSTGPTLSSHTKLDTKFPPG